MTFITEAQRHRGTEFLETEIWESGKRNFMSLCLCVKKQIRRSYVYF